MNEIKFPSAFTFLYVRRFKFMIIYWRLGIVHAHVNVDLPFGEMLARIISLKLALELSAQS